MAKMQNRQASNWRACRRDWCSDHLDTPDDADIRHKGRRQEQRELRTLAREALEERR